MAATNTKATLAFSRVQPFRRGLKKVWERERERDKENTTFPYPPFAATVATTDATVASNLSYTHNNPTRHPSPLSLSLFQSHNSKSGSASQSASDLPTSRVSFIPRSRSSLLLTARHWRLSRAWDTPRRVWGRRQRNKNVWAIDNDNRRLRLKINETGSLPSSFDRSFNRVCRMSFYTGIHHYAKIVIDRPDKYI